MTQIEDLVRAAHRGAYSDMVSVRRQVRAMGRGHAGQADLDTYLRGASTRDWISLDRSMRSYSWGDEPGWLDRWLEPVRQSLRAPAARKFDLLGVGLKSMDRDGHVREAAVRQLALSDDTLVGPFLTLRTRDWVERIAELATMTLSERMHSNPSIAIAAAPMLFRLARRQRPSAAEDVVLERAAAEPLVRTALLASSDRSTRRRLIGDRRVRNAAALDELLALTRTDPDPVVASGAGLEVVSRVARNGQPGVLASLLGAPAPVRRAVLEELGDMPDARSIVERHLFDRSPPVRAAAQRAYRRSGGDPEGVYREAMTVSKRVPIALTELANAGRPEDREAVIDGLRAPDVATRRAAANVVGRVASGELVELLTPLLSDASPGVTRIAAKRLLPVAADIDPELLIALAGGSAPHTRRAAYRLLRDRGVSDRLEANLRALADPDEANRRAAVADTRSWLNRGAASAPRPELESRHRLRQLLDRIEPTLTPNDVRAIRFHFGLRDEDLPQ